MFVLAFNNLVLRAGLLKSKLSRPELDFDLLLLAEGGPRFCFSPS
jgi:hypothetical protein